MLGSDPDADEARRKPSQVREAGHEPKRERKRELPGATQDQHSRDHPLLHQQLEALGDPGRQLAPALHLAQMPARQLPLAQRHGQNIGGRNRILDREVDPDPTDRNTLAR